MQTLNKDEEKLMAKAFAISMILEKNASEIDINGMFPMENLLELKKKRIMGLIVPSEFKGIGASINTTSKFVQVLGGSCLSTSMIFGMHCQQLYTIANLSDKEVAKKLLTEICEYQSYVASVTSEYKTGSNLLNAKSGLTWINDEEFIVERNAPTVTGGEYADAYLLTMKQHDNSLENEVALIYAPKENVDVKSNGKWESMGMRGTQSIPLTIRGELNKEQILNKEHFSILANRYMIPMGHIMWASSWLGAVKSIFKKAVKIIRKNSGKARSELIVHNLAEARLLIETVDNYLNTTINEYDNYLFNNENENLDWNLLNIHINNLKILSSENLTNSLEILMNTCGINYGYLLNEKIPLERTYRDIKSASLMFSNDKLKQINGKISLFKSNILDY